MLSGQLPVNLTAPNELFESANTGTAIYQMFQYGELPLIQNFDAHMLRSFLPNALYRFLSGDTLGSFWFGYSVLPLVAIFFYFFLKKFLSAQEAACLVLFFPWRSDIALAEYYGIALGVYLLLGHFLEKDKVSSSAALWLSCGGAVLYVLDVGTAVSMGVAVAALIALLGQRQWKKLTRTVVAGIASVALVLGALATAALSKGMSVMHWLREFMAAALSSQAWGGAVLGEGVEYFVAYVLLPALVVAVGVGVLRQWKKTEFADPKGGILLALGVTYLFNYQRALVRHTAAESYNNRFPLMGTALLFLPLGWMYLSQKKWKLQPGVMIAGGYIVTLTIVTLVGGGSIPWNGTLIQGLGGENEYLEYSSSLTRQRTTLVSEVENVYVPLKDFFDSTLEPEQTYIDFTDDTLLYALTGRYKPVYVNQSPGLLNGEYAQQCFIDQCTKTDCVYLLTWADFSKGALDGLSFYQRYYLVGEYLSQNYTPLCQVGEYEIWCRNDYLETQRAKLGGLEEVAPLVPEEEHIHTLRYLPLVWGEEDTREAQPIQTLLEQGTTGAGQAITAPLNVSVKDKEEGNYIQFTLTFQGSEQENITLSLIKEGTSVAQFQFKVKEGTHRYKIRVSGEPAWYQPGADSVSLLLWGDQTAQVEQLALCRGDTLKDFP